MNGPATTATDTARLLAGRPVSRPRADQPPAPDWCEPGQCTLNASCYADETGLTYVEGWARTPDHPGWVAHAWCVDPDGMVVDVTWPDTGPGFEYVAAADLDPFGRREPL